MGGSAVVNVAVGIVKTKIVAVILGPAGLGIIILLQNVMQTAASVASLGLGQAGTRQVAEANEEGNTNAIALVRRTLIVATATLGFIAAAVLWLAGDQLTAWFELGPQVASQMRWLAIGTALTVATQAQIALLMGFRRIGDLARVSTLSVIVSAVIGLTAVWLWGRGGIAAYVLSQVGATFVIGHFYVMRLKRSPKVLLSPGAVMHQFTTMLFFGAALTVAAVTVNVGQLLARTLIQQQLGAAAVGLFQAAWLVSVSYLGFVLQAMGADFYPRIVAAANEPQRLARLVNDQIEVALLLAAPVLLGMLGTAPWLMQLLYSRAFEPAVQVLQWQVLGDVLKVASWPIGYLLLAVNASRAYMVAEISAILVFLVALRLLLPIWGVQASGAAVLAMYVFYFAFVFGVAARRVRFRPTRGNLVLLGSLFAACLLMFFIARWMPLAGAALGIVLAAGAGGGCFWHLRHAAR